MVVPGSTSDTAQRKSRSKKRQQQYFRVKIGMEQGEHPLPWSITREN